MTRRAFELGSLTRLVPTSGTSTGTPVVGERPRRTANGWVVLQYTPRAGTVALYANGLRQASPEDYTVSGNTLRPVSSGAAALYSDPATALVVDYVR